MAWSGTRIDNENTKAKPLLPRAGAPPGSRGGNRAQRSTNLLAEAGNSGLHPHGLHRHRRLRILTVAKTDNG